MVTVTNQSQLWKQTFSWMLISLPHLLLLCLSSISLYLSPSLVLSPHPSATLVPVFSLFCQSFPSCSHLSSTQRTLVAYICWRPQASHSPLRTEHTLYIHISYQHIHTTHTVIYFLYLYTHLYMFLCLCLHVHV